MATSRVRRRLLLRPRLLAPGSMVRVRILVMLGIC
ncbi:hypothetical protein NC651_013706 [Populus alba x Populus x berolinensis]|nr:hypothetical protein NC651_013706 [Populus alba x Populus x berolinensis]